MGSNLAIAYPRRDAALSKKEDAEVMRALGWAVLALTSIPALFTAMGLVAGSLFWLWWTLGEAFTGLGCLAVSAHLSAAATRLARRELPKLSTGEEAAVAAENYESVAA